MFEKYITDNIILGDLWRKVEDSGEWSIFRRWLVMPPVQTNPVPKPHII
jgi:hypothetical protein